MDQTHNTSSQQPNLDGACEAELTDTQVITLYEGGLISRAEADVFDILANFNDNQGGTTACKA